jgi:hypothetical protein
MKNKLIKTIADKHESLGGIARRDENSYSIHPPSYESFAKDIIKECIQSIGGFQKTTRYRGKMILDHFGLTDKDLENN